MRLSHQAIFSAILDCKEGIFMKTPLRYQFTGHDCGTATMENALSYMIRREHLPPELLHYTYNFLLDGYTKRGWGFFGTSHESMSFFASWLKEYFNQHSHFRINVEFYRNEKVSLNFIKETFLKNSKKKICVVVYCYDWWGHYVLVTGFTKDGDVKIFDPFYRDKVVSVETPYIIVNDHPCEYNRIIPAASFDSSDAKVNFSLGPFDERDALFLIKDAVVRKK